MHDPFDLSYLDAAGACRPGYDDMLIGLEREFRAVDSAVVADRLDDLARGLFELGGEASPDEWVLAVARTAWSALPWEGSEPEHWMLGAALEERVGTGLVRAVVAREVARRAGYDARVARANQCWLVHVPGSTVAADVGRDQLGGALEDAMGTFCAHGVALLALTGLSTAWSEQGDDTLALRASGLRLLLPLDPAIRAAVKADVGRRLAST